jgi:hypothetical protein
MPRTDAQPPMHAMTATTAPPLRIRAHGNRFAATLVTGAHVPQWAKTASWKMRDAVLAAGRSEVVVGEKKSSNPSINKDGVKLQAQMNF